MVARAASPRSVSLRSYPTLSSDLSHTHWPFLIDRGEGEREGEGEGYQGMDAALVDGGEEGGDVGAEGVEAGDEGGEASVGGT